MRDTHRPMKTLRTDHPHDSYEYGCPDCEDWSGSCEPDFGNCPFCGQPKVVWNMTHAEAKNDPETQFEESCREILHS